MQRRPKEDGEEVRRSGFQRPESRSTESPDPIVASLPGRIGASARDLLRDTILQPPPGATAETIASFSPNTEKGDSSSSSAKSVSFTETSTPRPTSTSSDQSFRSKARGGIDVQTADHDFDAFNENSTFPTFGQAGESQYHAKLHLFDNSSYGNDDDGGHQTLAQASKAAGHHSTVSDVDQVDSAPKNMLLDPRVHPTPTQDQALLTSDGSQVVAMLSDPSFCLEEAPIECASSTSSKDHEKPESLYFSRSKELIFPNTIVNELQLIPESTNTSEALERMAATMPQVKDYAQDIDLQPWVEILNSYHDEVWGNILPLIREAREELSPSTNSKQTLDGKPALRRLQMLIGHLK